jgi:hypothetical protein
MLGFAPLYHFEAWYLWFRAWHVEPLSYQGARYDKQLRFPFHTCMISRESWPCFTLGRVENFPPSSSKQSMGVWQLSSFCHIYASLQCACSKPCHFCDLHKREASQNCFITLHEITKRTSHIASLVQYYCQRTHIILTRDVDHLLWSPCHAAHGAYKITTILVMARKWQ